MYIKCIHGRVSQSLYSYLSDHFSAVYHSTKTYNYECIVCLFYMKQLVHYNSFNVHDAKHSNLEVFKRIDHSIPQICTRSSVQINVR